MACQSIKLCTSYVREFETSVWRQNGKHRNKNKEEDEIEKYKREEEIGEE